jgi:hypothetical protein
MRIQHQWRPKKHFPFERHMAILDPRSQQELAVFHRSALKGGNCHARKHHRLQDIWKYIRHP